jgi:hypothetical protein
MLLEIERANVERCPAKFGSCVRKVTQRMDDLLFAGVSAPNASRLTARGRQKHSLCLLAQEDFFVAPN